MRNFYPVPASQRAIIVVEQFYADPDAVRAYALQQEYYYPYEVTAEVEAGRVAPTWWAQWFKPWQSCPFKSSLALRETLMRLTGEPIDLEHWCRPYPVKPDGKPFVRLAKQQLVSALWNCCFHAKPHTGQTLGNGVHVHTKADNWNAAGADGWAGIVYLNPEAPRNGGLHLWQERQPGSRTTWMGTAEDWDLIDSLGNIYNRLILSSWAAPA